MYTIQKNKQKHKLKKQQVLKNERREKEACVTQILRLQRTAA